MRKTCVCCSIEKDVTEFHKKRKSYNSRCKLCRKDDNEKARIRTARNRAENPQKIRDRQSLYNKQEHIKKRRSEKQRLRRDSDPEYRIRHNLRCRITKCIKNKSQNTMSLLGCSMDVFKLHIESKFIEGMNWENYGLWHIDHIIPCCSFDLMDENQQQICFHYTNLQPLWAKDNFSKGGRILPLGE
jgi:hypothetical protein